MKNKAERPTASFFHDLEVELDRFTGWGGKCFGGEMVNASDLKSDEQKMFLSVRSRSGVQIIKSPSEMNKVGRAVKGSAIMCYRFYYKAGGRIGTRTENP